MLNLISYLFSFNNNLTPDATLIGFLIALNCISSVLCISSPNPMVSLLFLILIFFNVSLMFMVLGLEFLSFLVLLVYVGAICILFIFVLMMLDIKVLLLKTFTYYKIIAISIFMLFFLLLIFLQCGLKFYMLFYYNDTKSYIIWAEVFFELSDMESLGFIIFNVYTFHFILITMLLFVVLIGSISIVKKTEDFNNHINLKKMGPSTLNFYSRYLISDFNKTKRISKINY